MKADPAETFIAVESVSATLAKFAARCACAALESAGRQVDLVVMPEMTEGTPLRGRTAGMISRVIRPLLNRRAVVLTPGPATLLALRRASGQFTDDDQHIAERWDNDIGEPNLTLLIDIDPAAMDLHDPQVLKFFGAARDDLIGMAGRHRESWVALPGHARRGALADDVARQVIQLLQGQTLRWPLVHGWRPIHSGGA